MRFANSYAEMRGLPLRARNRVNRLYVILLVGIASTGYGALQILSYNLGYSENLSLLKTGIIAGWSPDTGEVQPPGIEITILPRPSSGEASTLTVQISTWIWTNRSFPYVFGLITPFTIFKVMDSSVSESPDFYNEWGYYNASHGGSAVYFTSRPLLNNSALRAGPIRTGAMFAFGNLPYRDDHGRYAIVLPFGVGVPTDVLKDIGTRASFFINISLRMSVDLYVASDYVVTSSFPDFSNWQTFSYAGQGQAFHRLSYVLNGTSSLIVTYEDPEKVRNFANAQAWGLFWLGVGIPIIIPTAIQILGKSQARSSRSPSSNKKQDSGGDGESFFRPPFE